MVRAKRISDKTTDPQMLLSLVRQVRERIEIVHSSEYRNFLECYFPAFETLLAENTSPQVKQGHLNQVRFIVLEILNRLPSSELLKPFIVRLLKLTMSILAVDNQENALVCLKIIFSLHKHFRTMLKDHVDEFLEFVKTMYNKLEETRNTLFEPFTRTVDPGSYKSASQPPTSTSSSGSSSASSAMAPTELDTTLLKSNCSFKVVTECPLIVMLLFQLYPKRVHEYVKSFIPLMVTALNLAPPKLQPNVTVTSVLHGHLSDMVACQIKTLSFLTYLLKGFKQQMEPYEDVIARTVVELFKRCPAKNMSARKELLVATRHILATDFKRGFFKYVNVLMNESVLMGTRDQRQPP